MTIMEIWLSSGIYKSCRRILQAGYAAHSQMPQQKFEPFMGSLQAVSLRYANLNLLVVHLLKFIHYRGCIQGKSAVNDVKDSASKKVDNAGGDINAGAKRVVGDADAIAKSAGKSKCKSFW